MNDIVICSESREQFKDSREKRKYALERRVKRMKAKWSGWREVSGMYER